MADATTASVPRPPTTATDHNHNNKITQQKKNNPQRGVIYFRPITHADRSIIQTLHEQWFPVDYKSDFFDSLCSERPIHVGGMTSPLYCCVACFRELDEEEFEERVKRRKQREEESRGISSAWSSFWSSSSTQNTVDELDDGDEFDDGDCLLWESDNNSVASDVTRNNEGSYHEALTATTANSQPQTATTNDTKNDDALESGESEVSVHHRMEKEKMERFYSNGFRFDADDDHDTSFHNGNINGGSSNISNSDDESKRKKCKSDQGPYYNDNGECIIGCIVGSFLPSTMPSTKHRSSLDEKIGRDETATLLIPDSIRYTKMFYIMTLGTTREFRRCGLGSILVNRVVDMVEDREECGALYLHVITYNEGAIRLYERLGFSKVKDIKDYYSINSVNYDCYLYARYIHGNRGHKTTLCVLYDLASSIIRKLSHAFIPT